MQLARESTPLALGSGNGSRQVPRERTPADTPYIEGPRDPRSEHSLNLSVRGFGAPAPTQHSTHAIRECGRFIAHAKRWWRSPKRAATGLYNRDLRGPFRKMRARGPMNAGHFGRSLGKTRGLQLRQRHSLCQPDPDACGGRDVSAPAGAFGFMSPRVWANTFARPWEESMKASLAVMTFGLVLLGPLSAHAQGPALSPIANVNMNAGTTLNVNVVAVDAQNRPITLTAALPPFGTLNTPTVGNGVVVTSVTLTPTSAHVGDFSAAVTADRGRRLQRPGLPDHGQRRGLGPGADRQRARLWRKSRPGRRSPSRSTPAMPTGTPSRL